MNNRLFSLSLVVLLAVATAARADDSVILRTERGEMSASTRTIKAENELGNVTVVGVTEGFGWEWTLRSSGRPTSQAEANAQAWRLDVRETDGTLQLIANRPDAHGERVNRSDRPVRRFLSWMTLGVVSTSDPTVHSELKLRVPATSVVAVKNRFGGVRVTGTRGALNVDCQNGKVDLSNIEGAVTARTSFGSLRAEKIGPAQLTTQNGNLEASGIGGDLRATTSFAKLQVRDVKGDAVLKNQNGAIEAARITGDLSVATSFADLRIEEIGGKAEVKNQNGRVELSGVTGPVSAVGSFGSMRVHRLGGDARLKNQNGAIEALGVTGHVIVETSFGDMRIEEIGGDADLKSGNGKIEAARVTGSVRAATTFAALRVREIGGSADLDGQNSEIGAAAVGGDIRARTSFGRMKLEGDGRSIIARDQNGAVEIIARSPRVQQIEASASFATIDVRLPNDVKPLIRASTSFGKVQSDFPVLLGDALSDAKFAADVTPLKISLKGQNGDIRIQQLATR